MADPMDCAPGVNQASAQAWAYNYKQLVENAQSDIDADRKRTSRVNDAWETLRLFQQQSLVFKTHLVDVGVISSGQTGVTENQSAVTPIRTGVADTLAAASYPANRTIDVASAATSVAAAGVATANQAIADALGQFIALMNQGVSALQAVLVTAAGGASTPSQTQGKAPAA